MTPPDLVDDGDDETSKQIDFYVVKNSAMYNSEVSMISNVTKTGYAEILESILKDAKFDDKDLRTYHMLTKNSPKTSYLSIITLNYHSNDFPILEFKLILEIEA